MESGLGSLMEAEHRTQLCSTSNIIDTWPYVFKLPLNVSYCDHDHKFAAPSSKSSVISICFVNGFHFLRRCLKKDQQRRGLPKPTKKGPTESLSPTKKVTWTNLSQGENSTPQSSRSFTALAICFARAAGLVSPNHNQFHHDDELTSQSHREGAMASRIRCSWRRCGSNHDTSPSGPFSR